MGSEDRVKPDRVAKSVSEEQENSERVQNSESEGQEFTIFKQPIDSVTMFPLNNCERQNINFFEKNAL